MKAGRSLALLAFAALVGTLAFGADNRPTYTVGTVKEFLSKIGPNRIIVLKKGDYQLWTAYSQTSSAYTWLDSEDGDGGKELQIKKADNLTIRGQDGARLVTNSASAYLIGFYSGDNLAIENLAFLRQYSGDAQGAGLLYIESIGHVSLSKLGFSGPSGYPLELWDCGSVAIDTMTMTGGGDGAIYAGLVGDLAAKRLKVSACTGYPLLYFEGCGTVRIADSGFSNDSGANFLENWEGEEGAAGDVTLSACRFENEQFDFFSGTENVPTTTNCVFSGSSFGEDWMDNSVFHPQPSDYGEYGDEAYWDYHTDEESGLSFSYPADWESQDGDQPGQFGVFSPDEDSLAFFTKALPITKAFDATRDGKRLLGNALAALTKMLAAQGELNLKVEVEADLHSWDQGWRTDYRGTVTGKDGRKSELRLAMILLPTGIYGLAVVSPDPAALEAGGVLDGILSSLEVGGGGE